MAVARNISLFKPVTFRYVHYFHCRNKSYSSLDYCIELVRNADNENYLCSLLLPQNIRSAALAVRAFNVEVASVQDQVSQANIGLMRMKFWEDVVEKIYKGKVPNNPVAVELAKAVDRHALSRSHLLKLVRSRTARLGQTSFLTTKEMETYAEESCVPVLLLLLQAAKVKSKDCDHVAHHLGTAQGLTNLVRGLPHSVSKRILPLPSNLLAQHDVSEESVFRGTAPDSLVNVIYEIVDIAINHLLLAQEMKEEIPVNVRSIFLPAVPTYRYLSRLKNSSLDPFDGGLQKKDPLMPLRLYWNNFIKSY